MQHTRSRTVLMAMTAASLFAMFFGAGNLVFPPMLGAQAGDGFAPALLGFMLSAVALPILAVTAVAVTGGDILHLTSRGGRVFGVLFPVLVYLSIGASYALPRTGAVSYAASVPPLTGTDSWTAKAVFAVVFFGLTYLLALNPDGIIDTIGRYLTPALLGLMVLLVTLSLVRMERQPAAASAEYADQPFVSGFLQGYLTMDSLAALALGIVVITTLTHAGIEPGRRLLRSVSVAGLLAGLMLGAVYLGLALIGQRLPDGQGYTDGASMLSEAAHQTMGPTGTVVFALIVILACLTTSVGLLGATSSFFARLVPAVSYRTWAIVFSLVSLAISTLGLEQVIEVAAPIIGFLYPPAMALILLVLVEAALRLRLHLAYVLALAVALVWSAVMTLVGLGWGASALEPLISWSPGHAQQLGWVLPTLVAAVVGAVLDRVRGVPERAARPDTARTEPATA
ncbi:branched-chain amino acid transport system II carrier protein [Kytococcus schroeteri]|uniref:Branched-chain amino acid transport system II carrier protein n=2 Tax=Kytococcus schroeteri TaxID=138300 RepID=A0A2I1P9R1_9MICO|nr:branched-chain amino acid transport system II carrier protein [Kytococcus schroeteri]